MLGPETDCAVGIVPKSSGDFFPFGTFELIEKGRVFPISTGFVLDYQAPIPHNLHAPVESQSVAPQALTAALHVAVQQWVPVPEVPQRPVVH